MVSDTTYIYTEEGWLYLAAIMDLHGRKIVGMAICEKNDHNLVVAALEDAKDRIGKKHLEGCILHSDRGSTYASNEYVKKIKEYKMIGSMSRSGNCWDNAPMESFWGRMKVEWLNTCYKSKEEAIRDVYEYIWAYYNRARLHSTNEYATPEEYYSKRQLLSAITIYRCLCTLCPRKTGSTSAIPCQATFYAVENKILSSAPLLGVNRCE